MLLRKGQLPVFLVNIISIVGFSIYYLANQNYEFAIYIGVIIFFLAVLLGTNKKVEYPLLALWGLTAWALLHMAGGSIMIGETRLYELMIIPLSAKYPVFRYDQLVHIVGFGASTYIMYCVLQPLLKPDLRKWSALSIVVVMAGLGVGALNEVIEFMVTVIVPECGVGGYVNTSLDLVADLIGAILAMVAIRLSCQNKPI